MSKSKLRPMKIITGRTESGRPLRMKIFVRDARRSTAVDGLAVHAINSLAGYTFACTMHNIFMDKTNHESIVQAIGMDFHMVYVTRSRAVFINVEKQHRGCPTGVRYAHDYGEIVEMNDKGNIKKYAEEHPEKFNRSFLLFAPGNPDHRAKYDTGRSRSGTKGSRIYVPRGAKRRAQDAGLINEGLAAVLK